jgi:2-amino-4-hydroxy-6-hydroxymethyldihydropteridine diphosphokinase
VTDRPSLAAPAREVIAYVGLGANLGDAQATLREALAGLDALSDVHLVKTAPFYRTAPVEASGPDFVNTVACLRTTLSPWRLLDSLQALENRHGRERPYRNAPRTLDLDLLLYGSETIADERLAVPHPRMHERAFVLAPLADIAPDLMLAQGRIGDLLGRLQQPIERLP